MNLKFDLDPSLARVVLTALLQFGIVSLGSILVILQSGNIPTAVQALTIVVMASLGLLTSVQQFIKLEKEKEK